MANTGPHGHRTNLWAYAYEIVPPQSAVQLRAVQKLLEGEHDAVKGAGRTWAGQLVCDPMRTHILVVTDDPDQGRKVNQRIEASLRESHAAFSLTLPMAVTEENDHAPPVENPGGA